MLCTWPMWPVNWRTHVRSARSHSRIVPSSDAENSILPASMWLACAADDGGGGERARSNAGTHEDAPADDDAERGCASHSCTALTQSRCPRSVKHSPLRKFQTLTVASTEPDASTFESKWRHTTPAVWPASVRMHVPVRQFQTRSVPSMLPVMSFASSNCSARTARVCPRRQRTSAPLSRFQTRAVRSYEPVMRIGKDGWVSVSLNCRHIIPSVCPLSVRTEQRPRRQLRSIVRRSL